MEKFEWKFDLGQTVMTRGVSEFCEENSIREGQIAKLLMRHVNGDWGDIPVEDAKQNNFALKNKERLLSSYKLNGETVWIITEWDRSYTTILFPSEY